MEKLQVETPQPAQALWQTPRLYHAVTLAERIATLPKISNPRYIEGSENSEQAKKKIRQWKEQYPFDNPSYFADRLAQDAVTEQELFALLAEPIEALQARLVLPTPPDWLTELTQIFETYASDIPLPLQVVDENHDAYLLLQPFFPLLQRGIERFQIGVEELVRQYTVVPFNSQAVLELLFPNLAQQVLPEVNRTLVLELNIARLRGHLQGDTAQERFQSYVQRLQQCENLLPFLEEYCVLVRQVLMTVDLWVHCSLNFLGRLCKDWENILQLFTPEQDPGVLIEARGGAGDTHRGGQSVMLLKFQTGFQLVYKPRSLAIDVHFQELLSWLNQRGQHPTFHTLQLLNRGTHGWAEFVVASECSSEEEVVRFYERQGGYLALLYALKAVDFHAENIIAAGEHPVLIDLEALFHPDVKANLPSSKRPASQAIGNSVLRIALLPQRFWSNEQSEGVDMSGLGNSEGQLSPRAVAKWQGTGTDEMRIVHERIELQGNKNCPRLNGQKMQALDYIDSIITGFTTMYRLLSEQRDELLVELLPRFAHDEIRFIARATRVYAMLLGESFHPNMLRDALKRERFFDRLWMAVKHQPYLVRLILAERRDLFRGDIPLFTTHPDSRDLFTSEGKRIPEFFDESGLTLVKQCIQTLNEEDLSRQIWMIRAAFTSISTPVAPVADTSGQVAQPPSVYSHVSRERVISAACAIGDRLCSSALRGEDVADWLGVTRVKKRDWSVTPAGLDLSNGLPGIVLFLSYLGAITGEVRYTALARSAMKVLHMEIEQIKQVKTHLGWTDVAGIGVSTALQSCIYLFSHIAMLWHEPALLEEAEKLVSLFPEYIEKDEKFDIVDGSAGCIASLLSLYAVAPSTRTLTTAIMCGDRLLTCAQRMEQGVRWKLPHSETPGAGFGRGITGIAWSLLMLAHVSGEERFRETAHAALAYERSLFSGEQQNWSEPSNNTGTALNQPCEVEHVGKQKQDMSWGYGAPGLALGRLASLAYGDNTLIREEIEHALTLTIAEGFGYNHEHVGPNHSLYQGDFGNLETLLVAAYTLGTEQYREHLERIATRLVTSIDAHRWVMGVPLNVETPGLMSGLAGIGYALLRLAQPEHVPSVLLLAPPSFS